MIAVGAGGLGACGRAYDAADTATEPDAAPAGEEPHDASTLDAVVGSEGSTLDADPADRCRPGAPFGAGQAVTELNTSTIEFSARLTPDELTIYFSRWADANYAIFTATRTARSLAFSTPVAFAPANIDIRSSHPSPSDDGRAVYFYSQFDEGSVLDQSYVVSRSSTSAPFGAASLLGALGTSPYVRGDRSAMYSLIGNEIRRTQLPAAGSAPVLPSTVSILWTDPVPSRDELTLFLAGTELGGGPPTAPRIFVASRPSTADLFSSPAPLGVLAPTDANPANETPSWLSPDGCALYFDHGGDLYVSTRGL